MIRVDLTEDQITAALERLSRSLTNLAPVMQDIGELMVRSTKVRFTEGRAPDGNAWLPKSATTIAAYQARGDRVDFRPLFGPSGRLSSEIFYEVGADGASVEIGSNMIYSAVMQFGAAQGAFGATARGSPIPWGPIPARPFLGVSEEDRSNILAAIDEWLEAAVAGGN
jgi:phage virion morphogenesis protein